MAKPTDPDLLLLQAAADPTRLAILRQLSADGPTCACDFAERRAVSQPTVSHHLKVLREAGWIVGQRRGTWIWYSLRPAAIERFAAIAGGIRPGAPQPAEALGAGSSKMGSGADRSAPDGGTGEPSGGTRRVLPVIEPAWRQW
jgi:ArsR family transcriptional regulator